MLTIVIEDSLACCLDSLSSWREEGFGRGRKKKKKKELSKLVRRFQLSLSRSKLVQAVFSFVFKDLEDENSLRAVGKDSNHVH